MESDVVVAVLESLVPFLPAAATVGLLIAGLFLVQKLLDRVSLGYDVDRLRIESVLLAAAADAGLREPFVHVLDLGDFSVTYKVSGLLEEIKQLLSTRSRLRCAMLDRLHGDGIEIVSPSFVNQRPQDPARPVVPPARGRHAESSVADRAAPPESIVFDKADEAESIEQLKQRLKDARARIEEIEAELGKAADVAAKEALRRRIDAARDVEARIAAVIARRSERNESER